MYGIWFTYIRYNKQSSIMNLKKYSQFIIKCGGTGDMTTAGFSRPTTILISMFNITNLYELSVFREDYNLTSLSIISHVRRRPDLVVYQSDLWTVLGRRLYHQLYWSQSTTATASVPEDTPVAFTLRWVLQVRQSVPLKHKPHHKNKKNTWWSA